MTIKVSYTYASPVYINIGYGTVDGGAVWGDITGTLSNQADLQAALNAKFDDPTGTTLQYLRGDGSLATFPLTLPVLQQVRNQSGTTMNAGEVVYINGATGNLPTIARAIANADATSAQTLGMVQTAIANNGTGYVVVLGTIGNLDTSAYTEGQQLYLSGSVAGGVTTTKQLAPIHLVYVGIVTRSHPTQGTIEVKVQNGYELDEIHDVQIISPTNGQVLKYNSATQLWQNSSDTDTGITSLNALTALSQSFATGTSGTDFNISSATSTHTFNLPSASATNRGLLTSADWSTFNGKENVLTFSSPLSRSTNTISIPQATGSVNGFLSSTDWTTFNNKQNALTNPITGTGASGQVAYWSGTNTQTGSNNLFWDSANNRLGIGTASPVVSLDVRGEVAIAYNATYGLRFYNDGRNNWSSIGNTITGSTDSNLVFKTASGVMTYTGQGRLLLGSTTDNGLRFQVTGNSSFSDNIGIGGLSSAARIINISKNITGSTIGFGIAHVNNVASDVTSGARAYYSEVGTQAASFTLSELNHFYAVQGTFGAGSAVTSQYGFRVFSNLTGASNNYGFFGDIPSGTGRWNLYMNGTANNYLAGSLGIGTNAPTRNLDVLGTARVYGNLLLQSNFNSDISLNLLQTGKVDWYFTNKGATGNLVIGNGNGDLLNVTTLGNLGLGVTPSAWFTGSRVIQIGATAALWNNGTNNSSFSHNAIFGDASTTYIQTGLASYYRQLGGQHQWFNAPSGTAGNAITFTQAMTLDASGNLGLGTASPTSYSGFTTLSINNATNGGVLDLLINNVRTGSFYTGLSGADVNLYATANVPLKFGTNNTDRGRITAGGNWLIGTLSDAGYKLDVNGTMRVSGASTFNADMTLSLNQNATTSFTVSNTTNNIDAGALIKATVGTGGNHEMQFGKFGLTRTAFKIINASDGFIFNNSADIAILNNAASGSIKMAAGGSSTAQWTIGSNGDLTAADGENIIVGTTTGTKLGTATSQKIGFWNATPIVQPTTAVAAAAFVANTGTAVNDASTFDGYTMAQIVKALRNAGLLA